MSNGHRTDGVEQGAIYPGSDWGVYCDPSGIKDGFEENWEIHPVGELEEAGYEPCEMCYEDTDTDRSETDVCDSCGLERIGGRCLTRWCEERHESVDRVFGGGE